MSEIIVKAFSSNGLIAAFLIIGIVMLLTNFVSKKLTGGRIHPSALAILLGLVLAYVGGVVAKGSKGLADISMFSGVGILGGSMLRDFTIISTSYGAKISVIKKCGLVGVISLILGILLSYIAGLVVALCFGYTDYVSLSTIAAGAVTFVVGPVTGSALGASSDVIAISIAAGVVKSIAVMIVTPFIAKRIGLTTPKSAMIFGGLMGTTSGTAAGLAATDPALVPYGAMTATFYTGLGCLLCPSLLAMLTKVIFGS